MRPIVALFALLAVPTLGFRTDKGKFGWRLICGGFEQNARIDAIMSPGEPARHAHRFHGGSRFHSSMTWEDLRASNCTTCEVADDKSSYWVPPLYFRFANGTYVSLRQIGSSTIYYWIHEDKVQAFPAGFRMMAGNSSRRTHSDKLTLIEPDWQTSTWTPEEYTEEVNRERAIGANCLNYHGKAEPTLAYHYFRTKEELKQCKDGYRLELSFPSCWDGKNLDSDDHRSHVAYERFINRGEPCPSTHPVRIPTIMYETIWNVMDYADADGELVLGNGDTTGFGYHGDFVNGWDPAFLQRALDGCQNDHGETRNCPVFVQAGQLKEPGLCEAEGFQTLRSLQAEDCNGPMEKLCGSELWSSAAALQPSGSSTTTAIAASPLSAQTAGSSTCSTESSPSMSSEDDVVYTSPQASVTQYKQLSGLASVVTVTVTELSSTTTTVDSWTTVYSNETIKRRHMHHKRKN